MKNEGRRSELEACKIILTEKVLTDNKMNNFIAFGESCQKL